jgi:hypothetical protein
MAHLNIDERRKAVEEVIKTGFNVKKLKEIAIKYGCSYTACRSDFAYLQNKTGITLYPCPSVKENVRKRDNNTCQYCGEVGGEIIIEHVIPYIYGGLGKEYNLVCACQVCNTKKKKKVWIPKNIDVLISINKEWSDKILNHEKLTKY